MLKTLPKKSTIAVLSLADDAAILAAAQADPDALPLSDAQLAAMVPLRAVLGRPKSEHPKHLLSVRYSPEVITYFKSTGSGWQSRMDAVLKNYVAQQQGK